MGLMKLLATRGRKYKIYVERFDGQKVIVSPEEEVELHKQLAKNGCKPFNCFLGMEAVTVKPIFEIRKGE